MSGTSLDGIDIVIVSFQNEQPTLHHFETLPYDLALQTSLHELNLTQQIQLPDLAKLEQQLGSAYASAVNQVLKQQNILPNQVLAIGCHGQTIFHDPNIPMSLQIGHPAFIAKQTGIRTVADFRVDDMACNGQGAPLAPAFHQIIFKLNQPTAIVNIGGIANISIFNDGKITGFDTGPGNGLMDEICQTYFNQAYDANGNIAAKNSVNKALLHQLKQHPYFAQPAPKSTGRDIFNLNWLTEQLALTGLTTLTKKSTLKSIKPGVVLATLNQLTAETIAEAVQQHNIQNMIVCGGGAENQTLLNNLIILMDCPVQSSQAQAINPHAIEAMMCAWLAQQRCQNKPIQLTHITGAGKDAILGGIWEA